MTNESIRESYLRAKRKLFDTYFDSLNPEQKKAVFQVDGPLLILAGAGSGKTTVLVHRLAYLLRYGNAYHSENVPEGMNELFVKGMEEWTTLPKAELGERLKLFAENVPKPWRVMAITFTNKAAREIKERVRLLFGTEASEPDAIWSGTFHSVCLRLLRKYVSNTDFQPNFAIADTDDQKKLLKDCLQKLNIDAKNLPVKDIMFEMGRAKDALKSPDDYWQEAGQDYKKKQIARVYAAYQKRLHQDNLMDFDDIIYFTVRLLQENETVRKEIQEQFRYVCIDEYQDTNHAQFLLASLISQKHRNLMVVGDDDQSIYKFRGATIENILRFDSLFSDANVIKLEQNYRSTGHILDAANAVIRNNTQRHDKQLWTSRPKGSLLHLVHTNDAIQEAQTIAKVIQSRHEQGLPYRSFAILYRMNAQSRVIDEALTQKQIPFRVLSGIRFYDRAEVKDILSYLFVLHHPGDTTHTLRIINTPRRGIGDKTIDLVKDLSDMEGLPALEICRNIRRYPQFSSLSVKKLTEFAEFMDQLRQETKDMALTDMIRTILLRTDYDAYLKKEEKDSREVYEDKVQNLEELINSAAMYELSEENPSLTGYLESVTLIADVDKYDEEADAVVLMTIHSAKGLEFPCVFLPGMEEYVFPGIQTVLSCNPDDMEEERRLAYVAITRAKQELYLMNCNSRMVNGTSQMNGPSRFLQEIPDEFLEEDDRTSYGYQRNSFRYSWQDSYDRSFQTETSPYERRKTDPPVFGSSPGRQKSPSLDYLYKKETPPDKNQYAVGDQVRHHTFGTGTILKISPLGNDRLLEVAFDTVGTKKLMANFAKLTKLS